MTGLRIAPGLDLPIEAVTETFCILAKRGSGKTYTAKVLVEEMVDKGLPVCVIDPLGVWWGLRSSADGKSDGLPVVIFGGDHADVPLEETAGQLIADVIVDERISAVIDLSLLSKAAGRRFMVAFAERLQHRNRDALHLVVDEADMFAPQRAQAEGARLLGAMEDLVRRGRARGIGVTLISQRPAVLNKDVLTQAEVLIAMRMTGVRDVQAIDEWVKLHDVEDQAATVKGSLPSLAVGTAWVWSPGWLGVLQKVKIRRADTFDSSATPKPGQVKAVPKRMADIDLAQLGERIAATVEKAKADDPRELRRRISEISRELDKARGDLRARPDPVEVRHVPPELLGALSGAAALGAQIQRDLTVLVDELAAARVRHEPPQEGTSRGEASTGRSSAPASASTRPAVVLSAGSPTTERPAAARRETRPSTAAGTGDVTLGKTERTILTVLAQHGPLTHGQLALLSGYSAKASTIRNALAPLRRLGYVEPSQPITATAAGIEWLGDLEPLPQGEDLLQYWRHRFGATERAVLDVFLSVYPQSTTLAEVADVTGYSPTASTIRNALAPLRKVGVVDGWRLSDDFARAIGRG